MICEVRCMMKQVEEMMLATVRDVIIRANEVYQETPRDLWVTQWPGQVSFAKLLLSYNSSLYLK